MNVSWKVLRTSIAMSACLGLLAACQDRGQFHSKKWTSAELAKNLAAVNAQKDRERQASAGTPDGTPVATDPQRTSVTGKDDGKGFSKDDPAKNQPTPSTTEGTKDTGSSKGQLLIETLQDRNTFIEDNKKMMQAIDPLAVNTFKGITVTVGNLDGVFSIGVDAAIVIGKDLRYVAVPATPISYLDADAKPIPLKAKVKEGLEPDAKPITLNDQQLSILAVCSDLKCSEVHVRITVDGGKGKTVLAMVLGIEDNEYKVKNSNLKDQLVDFKTFSESARDDKAKDEKKEKTDGKPGDLPTTVTGDEKGKDVKKTEGDEGGTSDISKKGDKKKADGQSAADNEAALKEANAQTAKALSDDNAAAAKMVENSQALKEANAQTAKALSDDNAAAAKMATAQARAPGVLGDANGLAAAVIQPPSASAQKSLAFKQSTGVKQDSVPVLDLKPATRPMQVVQDPGQFAFEQKTAKAPGIFGETKGLAGAAVTAAPPAPTDPKVDAKSSAAPANAAWGKTPAQMEQEDLDALANWN